LILHLDTHAPQRGRHICSWNAIVDGSEKLGIGVPMLLLCDGQIGTSSAAACPQSMAQRAVDAEVRFARLRRIGIVRKRVAILCVEGYGQREQNQCTKHSVSNYGHNSISM